MRNQLIRQLQIDLITNDPNPIIEWFNDLWSRMYVMETNVYHINCGEFIYHMFIDGKKQWIFFQDNTNDKFWCNYSYYWLVLESRFGLKYDDIQDITKVLVENVLKNDIATANIIHGFHYTKVDNALKNNIATAMLASSNQQAKVEDALDNIITSPCYDVIKE